MTNVPRSARIRTVSPFLDPTGSPIPDPIGALRRELDGLHRLIDATARRAGPQAEAELRTHQAQLREHADVFFREFSKGKAEMESELAALRQKAEADLAEFQRLQQEATAPPPPEPPAAPEFEDDPPDLGGILQQELLQRFGDLAAPPQTSAGADASIWRALDESHHTWDERAGAAPSVPGAPAPAKAPSAAPPPAPKPKPADKSDESRYDKSLWEEFPE